MDEEYDNDMGEYMDEESSYSEGEEDDNYDAFNAYQDEEENHMEIEQPTSKKNKLHQLRAYETKVMEQRDLSELLLQKKVELQEKFEYAKLEDGIILKFLRDNNFDVQRSADALEQRIFEYLETHSLKAKPKGDDLICYIDYMELEEHEAYHLGCGHTFCGECFQAYIQQKISEGPRAIHAKCPEEGCSFTLSQQLVDMLSEKPTAEM